MKVPNFCLEGKKVWCDLVCECVYRISVWVCFGLLLVNICLKHLDMPVLLKLWYALVLICVAFKLGSLSLLHMFISVLVCQRLIINRNVIAKYWETYLERLPTVNLFLAPFFLQIVFWQLVCSTVSCWQSVTFCSRDSCESPGNWSQRWNCFRSGFFTVCSDFATNAQLLLSSSTQLPKKRSLLKRKWKWNENS